MGEVSQLIEDLIVQATDEDLLNALSRRVAVKSRPMADGSVKVTIRLKPRPRKKRPARAVPSPDAPNRFGL